LKNDVNVPSKRNKHKNLREKKFTDEKEQDPDPFVKGRYESEISEINTKIGKRDSHPNCV
jgi:hypothetical protein